MLPFGCLGPEHPWMIQIYAKHVPHPFASVMGQEVFESGIIPSDTDFRIYRDYGNIPGRQTIHTFYLNGIACFYKYFKLCNLFVFVRI